MRNRKAVAVIVAFLALSSLAAAADFDWMRDLSVRAEADPSGFSVSLASRFRVGSAEVQAVIGKVEQPADAYMVMRLGEMSGQPVEKVVEQYTKEKGKGWGALARSLGIKPGSPEFHALKRGHDLPKAGSGETGGGKDRGKKRK